jgi:hypothetical protein
VFSGKSIENPVQMLALSVGHAWVIAMARCRGVFVQISGGCFSNEYSWSYILDLLPAISIINGTSDSWATQRRGIRILSRVENSPSVRIILRGELGPDGRGLWFEESGTAEEPVRAQEQSAMIIKMKGLKNLCLSVRIKAEEARKSEGQSIAAQ